MVILESFERQNLITRYTKTHLIAPFQKNFSGGRGGHAPEPL